MTFQYVLPCVLALALAGCGQKENATVVVEPGAATNFNTTPTPSSPAANSPGTINPAPEVDLVQLTREVRKWIVRNQRPPKSFEDFAATSPVPIPAPPAQKKYSLTKEMRVILVNR